MAVVDREGDLITGAALKAGLPQLLLRGRLSLQHGDILVGEILKGWGPYATSVRPVVEQDMAEYPHLAKGGVKPGDEMLFVVGKIYDDTDFSLKVRAEIEKGELNSFSISGQSRVENKTNVCDSFTCKIVNQIDAVDLSAVTVCKTGMNQGAAFKVVAKSFEDRLEKVRVVRPEDIVVGYRSNHTEGPPDPNILNPIEEGLYPPDEEADSAYDQWRHPSEAEYSDYSFANPPGPIGVIEGEDNKNQTVRQFRQDYMKRSADERIAMLEKAMVPPNRPDDDDEARRVKDTLDLFAHPDENIPIERYPEYNRPEQPGHSVATNRNVADEMARPLDTNWTSAGRTNVDAARGTQNFRQRYLTRGPKRRQVSPKQESMIRHFERLGYEPVPASARDWERLEAPHAEGSVPKWARRRGEKMLSPEARLAFLEKRGPSWVSERDPDKFGRAAYTPYEQQERARGAVEGAEYPTMAQGRDKKGRPVGDLQQVGSHTPIPNKTGLRERAAWRTRIDPVSGSARHPEEMPAGSMDQLQSNPLERGRLGGRGGGMKINTMRQQKGPSRRKRQQMWTPRSGGGGARNIETGEERMGVDPDEMEAIERRGRVYHGWPRKAAPDPTNPKDWIRFASQPEQSEPRSDIQFNRATGLGDEMWDIYDRGGMLLPEATHRAAREAGKEPSFVLGETGQGAVPLGAVMDSNAAFPALDEFRQRHLQRSLDCGCGHGVRCCKSKAMGFEARLRVLEKSLDLYEIDPTAAEEIKQAVLNTPWARGNPNLAQFVVSELMDVAAEATEMEQAQPMEQPFEALGEPGADQAIDELQGEDFTMGDVEDEMYPPQRKGPVRDAARALTPRSQPQQQPKRDPRLMVPAGMEYSQWPDAMEFDFRPMGGNKVKGPYRPSYAGQDDPSSRSRSDRVGNTPWDDGSTDARVEGVNLDQIHEYLADRDSMQAGGYIPPGNRGGKLVQGRDPQAEQFGQRHLTRSFDERLEALT